MYSSSKFVFSFCKLLGLAPVKLIGSEYVFSARSFAANLLFLAFLIAIGLHALFSDYKNTFRGMSVRMKTRTAIVVTFLELLLSMVVITNAIIGAVFNYKKINRIESILRHVDDVLRVQLNFCNFAIALCFVLGHHVVLIFVDTYFWFNLTPYSWSYTVCYMYVLVEVAIEIQFAFITHSIGRRFCKINERLAENLHQAHEISFNLRSANSFPFEAFQNLHWSLSETIQIVNDAFGWQLLASILCICVHIVVTPYFFLLNLFYPAAYGSADIGFLVLQIVWIVTHHIHLFLLVIPASATTCEAKRATVILCEYLHCHILGRNLNQVETFILQLKGHPMKFSACSLFHLQRTIITSLIGSVITYLVILIQFQNSDKVYH